MKKKSIADHTDRELLQKSVMYQKQAADNTRFLKIYFIIVGVLSVVGTIILLAG